MNLVLIETSGNQQYIFSTNKLRENVGASELTYRVGTEWTLDAVYQQTRELGGRPLWPPDGDADRLRKNLGDDAMNPKIEEKKLPAEVIIATSGKALLLVDNRDVGREIVKHVTTNALKEAPGIDVCGIISDPFEWKDDKLSDFNRKVHEGFEEVRANRPRPGLRFLRVPVVADCRDSSWPAQKWDDSDPNDKKERSTVSLAKRARESSDRHPKHFQGYRDRMIGLLKRRNVQGRFPNNIGDLEKQCAWLAVIHADGNGLGEVFLKFGKYAGCEDAAQNRVYVKKFRDFSTALDICTENAFLFAAEQMVNNRANGSDTLPVLPIVLGGDDMTVVCDGQDALQFTYDFLIEFERQSEGTHDGVGDIIAQIAGNAFTPKRLSACAGVAIIKPHFPFSAAYELAEDLILSAKRVKKLVKDPNPDKLHWPCSTLDFHALYDASSSELDAIRKKLSARSKEHDSQTNREELVETRSYGRPYVITPAGSLDGAFGTTWAQQHHWNILAERVKLILAKETDEAGRETVRRKLPNTQLHVLRAGLPLGKEEADARFKLIKQRYDLRAFTGDQPDSLYQHELLDKAKGKDQDGKEIEIRTEFTGLLDAMDAANFWGE